MNSIAMLLLLMAVTSCGTNGGEETTDTRDTEIQVIEGPAGEAGSDGSTGKDGRDGINGKDGEKGDKGERGDSCTVQEAVNGALIICTDGTSVLVMHGTNGQDGNDGADGIDGVNGKDGTNGRDGLDGTSEVLELIDPCGDYPGIHDEILIRIGSGELVAYLEAGKGRRYLSILTPGSYRTTDAQECRFTVDQNGQVNW